jgi:hypothetical protein
MCLSELQLLHTFVHVVVIYLKESIFTRRWPSRSRQSENGFLSDSKEVFKYMDGYSRAISVQYSCGE